MSEIQYMEKPDWVSWDSVRICLNAAHQTNKRKGFEMRNSTITTDELLEEVKNSRCFIAMVDNTVAGVTCFRIENKKKWWRRGCAIYHFGDGILPQYRGTDVYFNVQALKMKFVEESGVRVQYFRTSSNNKTVIKINKIYGYKLVQFQPTKKKEGDYYQVTMVKWDDGCPFPDWFLKFMFNLSKIVSKMFYKRK